MDDKESKFKESSMTLEQAVEKSKDMALDLAGDYNFSDQNGDISWTRAANEPPEELTQGNQKQIPEQ